MQLYQDRLDNMRHTLQSSKNSSSVSPDKEEASDKQDFRKQLHFDYRNLNLEELKTNDQVDKLVRQMSKERLEGSTAHHTNQTGIFQTQQTGTLQSQAPLDITNDSLKYSSMMPGEKNFGQNSNLGLQSSAFNTSSVDFLKHLDEVKTGSSHKAMPSTGPIEPAEAPQQEIEEKPVKIHINQIRWKKPEEQKPSLPIWPPPMMDLGQGLGNESDLPSGTQLASLARPSDPEPPTQERDFAALDEIDVHPNHEVENDKMEDMMQRQSIFQSGINGEEDPSLELSPQNTGEKMLLHHQNFQGEQRAFKLNSVHSDSDQELSAAELEVREPQKQQQVEHVDDRQAIMARLGDFSMSGLTSMGASNIAATAAMKKLPPDSDSDLSASELKAEDDPNSLENRLRNIRNNLNLQVINKEKPNFSGLPQEQPPAPVPRLPQADNLHLDELEDLSMEQSEILIKSSARKIDEIQNLLGQPSQGVALPEQFYYPEHQRQPRFGDEDNQAHEVFQKPPPGRERLVSPPGSKYHEPTSVSLRNAKMGDSETSANGLDQSQGLMSSHLQGSYLQSSQISQKRDPSNEKIYTKVNLRQSSNDSTANRRAAMAAQQEQKMTEIEKIKKRYQQPAEHQELLSAEKAEPAPEMPNPMESELMNLQAKILQLESKLNNPTKMETAETSFKYNNAGSGESGDIKPSPPKEEAPPVNPLKESMTNEMTSYKQKLLGEMSNVVFAENYTSTGFGIFGGGGAEDHMFSPFTVGDQTDRKDDRISKLEPTEVETLKQSGMSEVEQPTRPAFNSTTKTMSNILTNRLGKQNDLLQSGRRTNSASQKKAVSGLHTQFRLGKSSSSSNIGLKNRLSQHQPETKRESSVMSSGNQRDLNRRTTASAAKTKEITQPHKFLRRSSSSLTRAFQLSSQKKVGGVKQTSRPTSRSRDRPVAHPARAQPSRDKFGRDKVISKSSIPENIHPKSAPEEPSEEQSGFMKEAAQKVVELQRQNLKLRQKLKEKDDVEEINNRLLDEVSEYKSKYIEAQRKHQRALEQMREAQNLHDQQVQANKQLRIELANLKRQMAPKGAKPKPSAMPTTHQRGSFQGRRSTSQSKRL